MAGKLKPFSARGPRQDFFPSPMQPVTVGRAEPKQRVAAAVTVAFPPAATLTGSVAAAVSPLSFQSKDKGFVGSQVNELPTIFTLKYGYFHIHFPSFPLHFSVLPCHSPPRHCCSSLLPPSPSALSSAVQCREYGITMLENLSRKVMRRFYIQSISPLMDTGFFLRVFSSLPVTDCGTRARP